MTTSVTRPCFTTQYQTCNCKTKTKTDFFVSDRGLVLRPTVSDHITVIYFLYMFLKLGTALVIELAVVPCHFQFRNYFCFVFGFGLRFHKASHVALQTWYLQEIQIWTVSWPQFLPSHSLTVHMQAGRYYLLFSFLFVLLVCCICMMYVFCAAFYA